MRSHVSLKLPNAGVLLPILRGVLPLVFALIYAGILVSLPLEAFKDRANYIVYAQASDLILDGYALKGWLSVAANEPLWLLINIGLSNFLTPENSLRVIIFIPAFIVSFLLLRSNHRHMLWMIFFLLMPQVIKNYIIHLRQGLAISVFMLGYFAGPKWLRIGLMGAAGFIHSSFLIIAVVGVIIWTTHMLRLFTILQIVFFAISFSLLSSALISIGNIFGARQGAGYAQSALDISGLGFFFWTGVLSLFLSKGMDFIREHLFPLSLLVLYLTAYFFTPVAARILESAILLVLATGISLRGWRRQTFLWGLVLYTLLLYLMRLDQPWLGWGVV